MSRILLVFIRTTPYLLIRRGWMLQENGKLYESTGDYINSSIRLTDLKTGRVIQKHMMGSKDIFGEGITIFKDKIYQLTLEKPPGKRIRYKRH